MLHLAVEYDLNCICVIHVKLKTIFPCVCREDDNDWIDLKYVEVMRRFAYYGNFLLLDGVTYTHDALA